MQKILVGHDTDSKGRAILGKEELLHLADIPIAFPPESTAVQKLMLGHDIAVRLLLVPDSIETIPLEFQVPPVVSGR
jgi:hypothetical protein